MEAKIKQGEEMIDATIEMVDGVMVVSPKEVFKPKDGDVISIFNKSYGVWMAAICRGIYNEGCSVYCMIDAEDEYSENLFKVSTSYGIRAATEEEKKLLFDKLAEEGYEFDFDKKELVKIKWKPKEGKQFWYPFMCIRTEYSPMSSYFNKGRDKDLMDKDWCFKTEQECQEFCNRLNEAINSVKP